MPPRRRSKRLGSKKLGSKKLGSKRLGSKRLGSRRKRPSEKKSRSSRRVVKGVYRSGNLLRRKLRSGKIRLIKFTNYVHNSARKKKHTFQLENRPEYINLMTEQQVRHEFITIMQDVTQFVIVITEDFVDSIQKFVKEFEQPGVEEKISAVDGDQVAEHLKKMAVFHKKLDRDTHIDTIILSFTCQYPDSKVVHPEYNNISGGKPYSDGKDLRMDATFNRTTKPS